MKKENLKLSQVFRYCPCSLISKKRLRLYITSIWCPFWAIVNKLCGHKFPERGLHTYMQTNVDLLITECLSTLHRYREKQVLFKCWGAIQDQQDSSISSMKIRSAGYQQVCLKSVPVYTLQGFISLFSLKVATLRLSFCVSARLARLYEELLVGMNAAGWRWPTDTKCWVNRATMSATVSCCWGVRIVLPMFSLKQSVIFYPSPSSISVYTNIYNSFSCALHIMNHCRSPTPWS